MVPKQKSEVSLESEKIFEITDKYKAAYLKKPIQDLLETLYYDLHRDIAINELKKEQDNHKYKDGWELD